MLVETQDKALRRISELREQCSLEKEAKAHLEQALRLEIEEREIVIKTLRSKMELLGEMPDKVFNGSLSTSNEESLINLSSDVDTSSEQNNLVASLENDIKEWQEKYSNELAKHQMNEKLITELKAELHSSQQNLQAHESTIAENKKTIHSELEKKDAEVIELLNELKLLKSDKLKLEERMKEVFEEKKSINGELIALKDTVEKISTKFKALSEEKVLLQKQNEQNQTKTDEITRDMNKALDEKTAEIASLHLINNENTSKLGAKIESLKNEKRDYEKTLDYEIRQKNEFKVQVTNIIQEIGRLEEQLKEVRHSHASIQLEKQKLEEKIGRIQRQHDEAKKQDKDQTMKWQAMIKEFENKLHEVQSENTQLSEQNCLLQENSRRNDELKKLQSNLTDTQDTTRLKELEERLTQCTSDHATLFDAKEQLEHQFRSLQDDCETKEKEKLCLMEDLKSLQNKFSQLENEKLNLTETCHNLRVVVDNIKKENDAMIRTRDELEKSCDKITAEFNKLNAIKQKCEQEMEALKRENKSLKNSLTDVENLLKQTHDEKQSLTESLRCNATDVEKKIENERVRDEKLQELSRLIFEKETEIKELKDVENSVSTTNQELESLNKELLAKINSFENTLRDYQSVKDENGVLASRCTDLNLHAEELNNVKIRLEKEIQSSRSIIKDLNDDFVAQSAVIQSLNEEKASLVEKLENSSTKVISESEANSAKSTKSFERIETLTNDNDKLQEINRELLAKLENLEKLSDRKILDLSQELENLLENSKHLNEKNTASACDEMDLLKAEKAEIEDRLKKIMDEVNDVSSKNLFLEQKVENFLILEQSYERLKVSNEKLSRQLDETLVRLQ